MIQDMHYATDLYALIIITLAVATSIVAYFAMVVKLVVQLGFKYAIGFSVVLFGFGLLLLMF
jgi:hypothetical protein